MAKKTKKKTAKKTKKKAAKKRTTSKPPALVAAEARVVGLKHIVEAGVQLQKGHRLLSGKAPKACTNAIAVARKAVQRAIKACAK